MKRIATILLTAMAFAHGHAGTTPADSLATATADSLPAACPTLQLPTAHADINAALLSLNFSQADALAKKQMAAAKRRREPTGGLEKVADLCRKGESGLRGIDRVVVVDSMVVDKRHFLSAYPLTDDIGTLTLSGQGDIVQFQTQINGMVLRPERSDTDSTNTLHMVRYYLDNGRLTEATPMDGLGTEGDVNYPFLMPDGQTFYFAARSADGYGNYDLYATRYDSDALRFYHAENMGYPYNSYANDYMLVINETANLGWFASDRYQPADKVCVYTFIPNPSRQTIDYETTDIEEVRMRAALHPLADIPLGDEQKRAIAEARRRMEQLATAAVSTQRRDFEFVLDDSKTCYCLSDFTTAEAQKLCSEWVQKAKNLAALHEQLLQLRDVSPSASQQILHLEKRIVELQNEVHVLEKRIRATELSAPAP